MTDEEQTQPETQTGEQTLNHLHNLAAQLSIYKDRKSEQDAALKETNKSISTVEAEMLEIFAAFGMTTFDHDGELFYQSVREFPTITKLSEDAFKAWLKEHGEEGLIKETVNAKSLEGWWNRNEEFQAELQLAKLIEVFSKVSISRRKR